MSKVELGGWGEARASDFLRARGYNIIEINYRTRYGEIDIIAEKDGFTVFIEVKLRKDASFAKAYEAVTHAKQAKITKAALYWMAKNGEVKLRFDVIEIYAPYGDKSTLLEINHIVNAFQ